MPGLVGQARRLGSRESDCGYAAEQGNLSAAKAVGSGVSELRLDFGPGYRVYFGSDGDELVILLAGGKKRRQQADIETTHVIWAEYKRRKLGG